MFYICIRQKRDIMDIKQLIAESGRGFYSVAKYLFPNNKFPSHALNRVISGGGEFSESQIKTLCALCFISVQEYYAGGLPKKHKTHLKTESAVGVYDSESKSLNVYKGVEVCALDEPIREDTKLSEVIQIINSF